LPAYPSKSVFVECLFAESTRNYGYHNEFFILSRRSWHHPLARPHPGRKRMFPAAPARRTEKQPANPDFASRAPSWNS